VNLSVYFTPLGLQPSDVAGRPVLVIDVLRATSTMVAALANGAKRVLPAESVEDALDLATNLASDDVLLAGERGYQSVEGFALGNSPREMTQEAVRHRTLVMSTTNGTAAIRSVGNAHPVLIGSVLNFTATANRARAVLEEAQELIILCAGHNRRFALEDAYTAGRFAQAVVRGLARRVRLNDAAIAARELVRHYGSDWRKAVNASAAARALRTFKLGADLAASTEPDKFDVVTTYAERRVSIES
jgi:2-phosphosulfolactate phosphatase